MDISRNKPQSILPDIARILLSKEDIRAKRNALKALKCYPFSKNLDIALDIMKKLKSFIIKKEIIDYIAKSNNKMIVLPLVNELHNPFYSVRESAILALKGIGDDRMFPHILDMARDPNPIYRIYSLEAIYHLYDLRLYNLLLDMLKDDNKSIRYYVLRCIKKNKLKKSISYVRNTALHDKSWEVRVKAIQIIKYFRDRDSLYVLLRCLKDLNRNVRFASASALFVMRLKASAFHLSNQLYSENYDDIKAVIINTLIKLRNAGGYKGLRKILLHDKNSKMRVMSAYALSRIRSKRSISILLGGIRDTDFKVRAEICHSLRYYKEKKVVVRLLKVINDDSIRYVKTAALYSLRRIRSKQSILPLLDRYSIETDPIFKDKLKLIIRRLFKQLT